LDKESIIAKCIKEKVLRVKYNGSEFLLVRDLCDVSSYKGLVVPLCEFREVDDLDRYLKIRRQFANVLGNGIRITWYGDRYERKSTPSI
jgi:hypothetical protein